jgi:hypothetical protein
MNPLYGALALSGTLLLIGGVSAWFQWKGRRELRSRKHVPSDECAYLRGRYRRRFLAAGLMIVAGCMIAGAYLSGMEADADGIKAQIGADGEKKPIPDGDRAFVRLWGVYWIGVVVLAFVLIGVALTDAWASRRYWHGVYKVLREEHQTKLRRDLAVYQQSKDDRGAKRGKL